MGPDMNPSRPYYIFPSHDTWVKLPKEEGMEAFKEGIESYHRMNLNESTQTNQPLKRGDEVMIVDLDHCQSWVLVQLKGRSIFRHLCFSVAIAT